MVICGLVLHNVKTTALRAATEADLPKIVAIYNAAIPAGRSTADIDPVSIDDKRDWFAKHNPHQRPLLVYEQDAEIVAWLSFEDFYGRPAYAHTAELSIYIDPKHQNSGLGRQLLTQAVSRAPALGIKTILGYVFAHNTPSMRLLHAFDFQEWGRLPDIAEIDGKQISVCIMGKRLR